MRTGDVTAPVAALSLLPSCAGPLSMRFPAPPRLPLLILESNDQVPKLRRPLACRGLAIVDMNPVFAHAHNIAGGNLLLRRSQDDHRIATLEIGDGQIASRQQSIFRPDGHDTPDHRLRMLPAICRHGVITNRCCLRLGLLSLLMSAASQQNDLEQAQPNRAQPSHVNSWVYF